MGLQRDQMAPYYSQMIALTIDAIICVDQDQRIILFNSGAEQVFQHRAHDVIGQSLNCLLPERFRAAHAGHVRHFAAAPSVSRHMGDRQIIYALRKSGEEFPAEATISKITAPSGYILTVVLRDVTERVQAEERRRKDAEKLRQALASGRLGAFEYDVSHDQVSLLGQAGAIHRVEVSPCNLTQWLAPLHPEDAARLRALLQYKGPAKASVMTDYRVLNPDASLSWVRLIIAAQSEGPASDCLFCTVQDITEQKDIEIELERRVTERTQALEAEITQRELAQKQLLAAQRMEAFGQLTGGIAHDFNNLLTVIGGNLELLDPQIIGERPRRQYGRAIEAVEMGARLTRRLLAFALRNTLEPQTLDLNEQVINLIDILRRTIGEIITISSTLAPDLGMVCADASEVENAILNLAINARDAMPDGGKLVIETANVTIDETFGKLAELKAVTPGHYVRLSVSDTGCGMPPDVIVKAFEPFFTTKEHGRGTGLGLSTVYGFARQSGGYATLYSEPGQGTTVNLYLPRTDADRVKPVSAQARMPRFLGKRILVVEDNADVREITMGRLDAFGYACLSCESGPAAIAVLEGRDDIDLVFSDIMMTGGLSGYDLADWILRHRPGLKILLTSGFAGSQPAGLSPALAHLKVLRKPYAAEELRKALAGCLSEE
jgi:PAS domain S-box-containing protein